jgi:hypothetical protein
MGEWRRNGTCSACAHFEVDFGEPPDLLGHCKMYPRTGSRQASDATCHVFTPEEGFAERVTIAARTSVPDSSRQRAAPGRTLLGGELARPPEDDPVPPPVRRREGVVVSPSPEPAPEPFAAADALAEAEALREVLERFGVLAPVPLHPALTGTALHIAPADTGLKPAELDLDTLLKKLTSVRERMRLVEQKVNAHTRLVETERLELQHFVTRVFGAVSAFSGLFREESETWHARRGARWRFEGLLKAWDDFRPFELAPKWQGGKVLVRGADSGDVRLAFPTELLFERTGRLRDALERLSRAVDRHPRLDADDKATLEDYVAKSNGSLTTLNILFRHAEDRFSSK